MKTVNPRPEQLADAFSNIPKGLPVVMLNLLKFREQALYPDGSADCTGRKAYERYSKEALVHLGIIGGKPIFMGKACAELIAPPEEHWDEVLLVRYPSIEKFMEMVTNPDYQKSAVHRTAALEDSRLVATVDSGNISA
ncbi:MAG: DUF1330 domain-containing protein [Proteobacteria bacterium]|nr:DUF1330 domain-containing protein [Pseudomonadota bacterium]